MIALLTGRIRQQGDTAAVPDVNGVGYLVQASTRTPATLPQPPATARRLVETHVREDTCQPYGFTDPAKREWLHSPKPGPSSSAVGLPPCLLRSATEQHPVVHHAE